MSTCYYLCDNQADYVNRFGDMACRLHKERVETTWPNEDLGWRVREEAQLILRQPLMPNLRTQEHLGARDVPTPPGPVPPVQRGVRSGTEARQHGVATPGHRPAGQDHSEESMMAGIWNGYGISDEEEMAKHGLSDYDPATSWRGYPRCVVVRYVEGKPHEIVGMDGGEPEDQTLDRDWSWVVDELNAARKRGFEEGFARGRQGD